MVSLSSVISRRVLWTSTIGVSPVTVIVSSTPPTRSSPLTVVTAVPLTMRPSLPHGDEAGERERHGVGAGAKILDSVTARPVGDRRANLLNQLGAGGFHRYAWQ